jgi:hypothetical protein
MQGPTTMDAPQTPDPLSRTLEAWRVQPARDPQFRSEVRQRLASGSTESWSRYLRAHGVGWSVAAALGIAVAGWTGRAAAKVRLEAERHAMVEAYLVELDPRVQAKLRH